MGADRVKRRALALFVPVHLSTSAPLFMLRTERFSVQPLLTTSILLISYCRYPYSLHTCVDDGNALDVMIVQILQALIYLTSAVRKCFPNFADSPCAPAVSRLVLGDKLCLEIISLLAMGDISVSKRHNHQK